MKARSELARKPKTMSAKSVRTTHSMESSSAADECPREQMIAEAAYFRAERRGFAPGNEMSDWLQAEADVESVMRGSQ